MGFLARTCLPAAVVLGLCFAPVSWADAAPATSACKAKRAKKKPVKRRARKVAKKPAKPKVTALTISKWQKKKLKEDQIVEKAMAAGYRVTKLEKKKLLKYKVKKPLIAKLEEAQEAMATDEDVEVAEVSTPAKEPTFDLDKTIDPNEIDFDSVAPPKGMPKAVAKKQQEEAEEKKPVASAAPAKSDDNKTKRVVIAAGK